MTEKIEQSICNKHQIYMSLRCFHLKCNNNQSSMCAKCEPEHRCPEKSVKTEKNIIEMVTEKILKVLKQIQEADSKYEAYISTISKSLRDNKTEENQFLNKMISSLQSQKQWFKEKIGRIKQTQQLFKIDLSLIQYFGTIKCKKLIQAKLTLSSAKGMKQFKKKEAKITTLLVKENIMRFKSMLAHLSEEIKVLEAQINKSLTFQFKQLLSMKQSLFKSKNRAKEIHYQNEHQITEKSKENIVNLTDKKKKKSKTVVNIGAWPIQPFKNKN